MPYQTETIPRTGSKAHIAKLKTEKNEIIKELLVAKDKNQQLILQQQQFQRQLLDVNHLLEETSVKNQNLTAEIKDLKQQIEIAKTDSIEKSKIIASLKQEKKLLAAQVNQLQMNTCHATKSSDKSQSEENSSDGEYEVDSILSHKFKGKQRLFYVHWKGYSQDHDSWVKEKDLNCPTILMNYLHEHNLK